jgi:radical SAM superfamily enzyme YgiQ (UPF0313 family)
MKTRKKLWLDLGKAGSLITNLMCHQDHAVGLLRTILHNAGIETVLASTRNIYSRSQLRRKFKDIDILIMSVLSFNYPLAVKCARLFKELNPEGIVIVGGLHASVAIDEMISVKEFDYICKGPGEKTIIQLVTEPEKFERVIEGKGEKSVANWPDIDRTLWPRPALKIPGLLNTWPLEKHSIEKAPSVTILTSRVCPWQCAFCNESSYIPTMVRKPVEMVINELNTVDRQFGPFNSVIMHDSNFFQNPTWLREWIEKYSKLGNSKWPYWAAARTDTIRKWPDLFVALLKETNWRTISLGLESGSDPVLRILNKECTEKDNHFAIDLINRIGDEMLAKGLNPPRVFANIMLAIPGETKSDARKTVDMVNRIHRVKPSVSFFAPYPGSILGYQLIAEGKSLMSRNDYHRYPGRETVKGIDYQFYNELVSEIEGYQGSNKRAGLVRKLYKNYFSRVLGEI